MTPAVKTRSLSLAEARRRVLRAQWLWPASRSVTPKDIVSHLGYVQIDTIAAVERAHHHVLWTRCPGYQSGDLHRLQAEERAVFEYWGHAMSYLSMADYRYFLPRMDNFHNPRSPWAVYQLGKAAHLLAPVLERIRQEGPLGAADFESDRKKGGTWWDWKPAKVALELLFWRGDLMISERRNFQKIYDLTERVLPREIDTRFPEPEEVGRFLAVGALRSLGVATEREVLRFMQPATTRDSDWLAVGKAVVAQALHALVEGGKAEAVHLEGTKGPIHYTLTGPDGKEESPPEARPLHILSPFDNLVIQRERTKRLFDFDYMLECYVPEPKRRWGYFVLPLLWGETFVGRLDAKADRRTQTLEVRSLYVETDPVPDGLIPALAHSLWRYARFNGCEAVRVWAITPAKLRRFLESAVRKIQ